MCRLMNGKLESKSVGFELELLYKANYKLVNLLLCEV